MTAIIVAALLAPVAVAAQPAPLGPDEVTRENGDAAIRCAMLSQIAKNAAFFTDVPNGQVLVARLNDRMLEIARHAAPEATNEEMLVRMKAAFADYDKLTVDGATLKKGEMMKADFQICLERAGELFGKDLLPDG
ncbi:hypothetical protein [uncultured Nitratireductor sp.]|uniref:hypothetical protein n=1 Tax=uncultured Nitratireductor sp. TaxID=520953 RepID=UPI0025E70528|nr:hypothetical protein [uncultured Nitratireductor sp.]